MICGLCDKTFNPETDGCGRCVCGAPQHYFCCKPSAIVAIERGVKRYSNIINKFMGLFPDDTEIFKSTECVPKLKFKILDHLRFQIGYYKTYYMRTCIYCHHVDYIFTNQTIFNKFRMFLDRFSMYSEYIDVGFILLNVFMNFNIFGAFTMGSLINWSFDDFIFDGSFNTVVQVILIPHFIYTLSSSTVYTSHILLATAYSYYGFGIPTFGITSYLKKLMATKLLSNLVYKLTINRYFYESLKKIPIAIFKDNMQIDDMIKIQKYRNNTGMDAYQEYKNKGIFKRIQGWILDTWTCLKYDFGIMFINTSFDKLCLLLDSSLPLVCGTLTGLLTYSHPYYSVKQNHAYMSTFGLILPQLITRGIQTYNSIELIRKFNNMEKGSTIVEEDNHV